jgi:hypothetical protein
LEEQSKYGLTVISCIARKMIGTEIVHDEVCWDVVVVVVVVAMANLSGP